MVPNWEHSGNFENFSGNFEIFLLSKSWHVGLNKVYAIG